MKMYTQAEGDSNKAIDLFRYLKFNCIFSILYMGFLQLQRSNNQFAFI